MTRLDATRALLGLLDHQPVLSNLGGNSYDLLAAGDRPENFYTWGAMASVSSVGLGLALSQPSLRVIVLDGDGSLLMNLGSLATIAAQRPPNLVHIVFDNRMYETTGGQATHTARGASLTAIARGAGLARVEDIAKTITEQVDGENREENSDTRDHGHEGRLLHVLLSADVEHVPPRGGREAHAQTQEAERRFDKDDRPHGDRPDDDDRGERVGQDVPEDNPPGRGPKRPGRFHVWHLLQAQDGPPDDPRSSRGDEYGDGDDHIPETLIERRGEHHQEDEWRQRHHRVHHPLDEHVDESASVPTDEAEQHTEGDTDGCRAEAGAERIATAIQHPGPDVASQFIGAEVMLRTRIGEPRTEVRPVRVMGRKHGRKRAEKADDEQQDRRSGGERLPA